MQLDLLPEIIKKIEAFRVLGNVSEKDFEKARAYIEELDKNQYFLEATESGIKRYEKMLKITPLDTEELEDRKFRVHSFYNHKLPYTERSVQATLDELVGSGNYLFLLDKENKHLIVKLGLVRKSMYSTISWYLEETIPLDFTLEISLLYNTFAQLEAFTHEELEEKTHEELKDEVL